MIKYFAPPWDGTEIGPHRSVCTSSNGSEALFTGRLSNLLCCFVFTQTGQLTLNWSSLAAWISCFPTIILTERTFRCPSRLCHSSSEGIRDFLALLNVAHS